MNNNAKYAFYYLLSLVALIFVAINSGIVIFQIINKFIPDTLSNYSDSVSQEMLRFAIASLLFATPVLHWMTKLISAGLVKKDIDLSAPIRRWLTYLIIFICSVVILVWLIITMNSFLNGELTLKAILKTLTILGIAGSIFSYYFYDIRKDKVVERDLVQLIFCWSTLAVVSIIFVAALCIMDKPSVVRGQRHDQAVINELSMIDSAINQYYISNGRLPDDLNELRNAPGVYLRDDNFSDDKGGDYRYQAGSDNSYQLCANFALATETDNKYSYLEPKWDHQAGEQCFDLVVVKQDLPAVPVKQ